MADYSRILIGRGLKEYLPEKLSIGEFVFADDTEELFIGGRTKNIKIPTKKELDTEVDNIANVQLPKKADLTNADFQILKRGGFSVWDGDNFPVEKGTFKPFLRSVTTDGELTYTTQNGWYLRQGRKVKVWLMLVVDQVINPPTGRWIMGGLPLPMERSAPSGYTYNLNITRGSAINGVYPRSGLMYNVDTIYILSDSYGYLTIDDITSGYIIYGNGSYLTN